MLIDFASSFITSFASNCSQKLNGTLASCAALPLLADISTGDS